MIPCMEVASLSRTGSRRPSNEAGRKKFQQAQFQTNTHGRAGGQGCVGGASNGAGGVTFRPSSLTAYRECWNGEFFRLGAAMRPVPNSDALSLVEALAALHLREIRSEAVAL